ncbi:MAG: PIN domain-containing protein [Aeromonadaceae bacterium]
MANRVLIIANDTLSALPVNIMDKFQQVIIFIAQGESSLPLELVRQLLTIQAESKSRIELQQVKGQTAAALDLSLALQVGRLVERSPESQITLLSSDERHDALVQSCLEEGTQIHRLDTLQARPAETKARAASHSQGESVAEPAPTRAAAAKQPEPEKENAAHRNHKLISSLIGAPPRQ